MRDVVIVDSVRTGLAKSFRGTFNLTRPDDMVAHCIDALLERNPKLDPAEVEDVIVGSASQTDVAGHCSDAYKVSPPGRRHDGKGIIDPWVAVENDTGAVVHAENLARNRW